MQDNTIELLATFDKNYIPPFQVLLKSLSVTNPRESFRIWLLHSAIPEEDLRGLAAYCGALGMELEPIQVSRDLFEDAPVSKQYPREMYYRMLAPVLLPDTLDRVLYLDPDILALNPVRPLWELPLGEAVFAAASHSAISEIINDVNRIRLNSGSDYFNTGVLLMDLAGARKIVRPEEIFACVRKQAEFLVLPDQDVFNMLYGARTAQLDDTVWNYDARYASAYLLKSEGKCDLDWVMRNTVFLHFCGKHKPWKSASFRRFTILYRHYMNLARGVGAQ